MSPTEHVTYCRICEPLCGMIATVEDEKVTKLRPDPDHPLSCGQACAKGIAMTEVQNDPDRLLHPQRRRPDGSFERISWEVALDEIGRRLGAVKDAHGGGAIGWYMGNPGAFSYSHPLWVKGFVDGLGSPHYYTASSQDVANRFAASSLLYGSPFVLPIPDLARTDLLLVIGANPLVSHGSVMSAPRIKDQLNEIVARGGRVVVVDPRRSETARAFEHLPVRPDSDAFLLLSLLQVTFAEGLQDRGAIEALAEGAGELRALVARFTPEETAATTGVEPERIRELARAIAGSERAAIYGRTGSCLGSNGTVVAALLDALALVTGNLDRAGGSMFGQAAIPFDRLAEVIGAGSYGKRRSRVGDFPEVLGAMPASLMAKEITTPGPGQLRALFISAGNPVLSVPNGAELREALGELDLCVAIDIYPSDTAKHADYVLPATTFLEREDIPLPFLSLFTKPFINMTEAVVEPAGEAKQEWEVVEEISARIGIVPSSVLAARWLGRAGLKLSPRALVDLLLRLGPEGDKLGLKRGGLSLGKLAESPHGIVLGEELEEGVLPGKIRHRPKRVRLCPPEIEDEVRGLGARPTDEELPLRLINLRELRSHNSWMHNSPKLMAGDRVQRARINPRDAEAVGIADGERARIVSARGEIEIEAKLTDEVIEGAVAVPHGWGHDGGWQLANAAGGQNVNQLASSEAGDLERLAGMAHLTGIPIRIEPVASGSEAERDAAASVA